MTLSLAGPQTIEELREMAEAFASVIAQGVKVPQESPAPLMSSCETRYQQAGERRLDCLFTLEALPESCAEALRFLCHWLNSGKPGGLLADLRERGLAEQLKAEVLYHFAGQAVLHVEFTQTDSPATGIGERLKDWLGFFARQDWRPLRDEYAALLQRRQQVASALQLARLDSEQTDVGLSEQAVTALKAILEKIDAVDNFTGPWQLPAPNPFLNTEKPTANAGLIRGQTSAHRGLRTFAQDRSRGRRERSPMQFSQALPDHGPEGSIYLRWCLEGAPGSDLQSQLENQLRPLQEDAHQAGVDLSFSASGNGWLLKMTGLQEPMPAVLEHALKELTKPDAVAPHPKSTGSALIPIRQLLKALPGHCLASSTTSDDAQPLWSSARWDGLALGLSAQTQAAMGVALSRIPGTPDTQPTPPPSIRLQRLWSALDTGSSEHALLLFCPTADKNIAGEAAWRLLAHLYQTPFYQRLRVELQLGYAVFSALRQIHGTTGLLFGVQSPNVPPAQLLQHIEDFIGGLPALVEAMDDDTFIEQRQTLAEQFSSEALPTVQAAELLWQGKLAGRSSDYLEQLADAILQIDRSLLLNAARQLMEADGGWRCLANAASPGQPWQAAK
jgi:coenzyme PQQ biosynthesis probable peptidase PqqF